MTMHISAVENGTCSAASLCTRRCEKSVFGADSALCTIYALGMLLIQLIVYVYHHGQEVWSHFGSV